MQIRTGKTQSIPAGLSLGAGVSVAVTISVIAILGTMIEREDLAWENVGYGIMLLLFLAAFLGSKTAWWSIRRQKLMICILSGLVYYGILLSVTALFFGGQYEAVLVTGGMILSGSGAAALTGRGNNARKKQKNSIRPR